MWASFVECDSVVSMPWVFADGACACGRVVYGVVTKWSLSMERFLLGVVDFIGYVYRFGEDVTNGALYAI